MPRCATKQMLVTPKPLPSWTSPPHWCSRRFHRDQHTGRGARRLRWSILGADVPYFLERVPDLLDKNNAARMIHDLEVVGTGVGEDVGAIGAACLVLEHMLAPRAQRLLLEG